jgi:glycosyltransferase involved in cell wall biosynthesis
VLKPSPARDALDHEAAIAAAPYRRHRRLHRSRSHPRPRVLQLLATGGTGGAQESYTGLLLGLDRSRFDVLALSLSSGKAVSRLRGLGIEVEVVDDADDEAAVRELTDYLRRREIDLVHAHMFRAEVLGARAALAAGTPVLIATVHSSRVRSARDQEQLAALTPQMDRLIVPSASIAAKVRAEGRSGAPFAIVANGIDLSRFRLPASPCSLRSELGIPVHAPLIGVVARLEPEKGHRYLLGAMPHVLHRARDAWLVVVGEGSLDDELRSRAAALGPPAADRIAFVGRRDDISAITADLTVAVLPSLREAQGISILEAMARTVPVVATRVGGIPEVITDGVDGLLVPPADAARLAEALSRLLADPDLRARLGAAGYRTVAERFSIDAQVRRIERIYDEELSRAGVLAALGMTPYGPDGDGAGPAAAERAVLEVPPT